ncbi:MAG: class I SAM-dependent methyltransferase [Thermodesulfovibrionia bacterium]|nr:class I SAM-dependent methyltransferase [Thermodesulfovibrionia bacterium]
MPDFHKRWFERRLQHYVKTVHNSYLGNYTTAYNSWKRLESIKSFSKEEISRMKGDLRILDAGCGDALPLYIMASQDNLKNINFYGIDASELDITFAENLKTLLDFDNFTFNVGNIEKLPFEDSFFDIVICSEVVEHMEYPETCLMEIKRVLKDDGTFIISTPNSDNLLVKISSLFKGPDKSSDINIIAEEKQGQNNDHIHDDHISTRGVSAWKQTFISSGFSVKSMKRHSILYGGNKYNRHRILFAFIMLMDSILDRFPFGYSLSEGVTYKLKKEIA